ncbi:MAG: amino acid adenylation domain-containing protein [Pseudomonadota bacterium]
MLHDYLLGAGRSFPDKAALVCRDTEWTYAELERRAAGYAVSLRSSGVRPEDRVALVLDPCPEAIALILACSMIGAVFVPLSPEMPQQRLDGVLHSVEPAAVVRHGDGEQLRVTLADGERVLEPAAGASAQAAQKGIAHRPHRVAYIIFTSGTTGQPKGIMASHHAAVAFFRAFSRYGVDAGDRIGTVAPLQFDFSLCDLGVALGSGATLVQVPRLLVHKPAAFIDYLARKRVTVMHAVPSVWTGLLSATPGGLAGLAQLRAIMYAGETFPPHQLRVLEEQLPQVAIVQGFGHSESIGCSFKRLPRPFLQLDGKVPVGRAIEGMEMFLVDERLREITRPHVLGELYVKGEALFCGYWKDPALTAAVLVEDPRPGATAGLAFKSGDRMFMDEAGDFYSCGRVDLMVKVNGYRVELEEIELRLASHPLVAEAAVVPHLEDGRLQLLACVVPAPGSGAAFAGLLQDHCAQALPRYMRPSAYRFVAQLPKTVNGKLDRARLRDA